jgi:hypothetical protein
MLLHSMKSSYPSIKNAGTMSTSFRRHLFFTVR